jgi:hypothetical protein
VTSEADQATLSYAVCLLGSNRDPAVIPELVELLRRFDDETLEDVANSLGPFGEAAIDPVLAVAWDERLGAPARSEATTAAILAAGDDPALREKVGTVLRDQLSSYLARVADLSADEKGMATMLVIDLTNLADAAARPLIDAAFAAGIVDPTFFRPEDVTFYYEQGGEALPRPGHTDWLDEYQDLYDEEMKARAEEVLDDD